MQKITLSARESGSSTPVTAPGSPHGTPWLRLAPGILASLALAVPATLLGMAFPLAGGPVAGLGLGLAAGALLRRFRPGRAPILAPGCAFTAGKGLRVAVVLLGAGISFLQAVHMGLSSLGTLALTLPAGFLTAWVGGKLLKLGRDETILVGTGTCICGASAIAAAAPAIGAEKEATARSLSVIFLFNVAAVFIFPALGRLLGMDDAAFGTWAGTAVNDTSSVVAAAASWGQSRGTAAALDIATVTKLTRSLMILPVTLVLALVFAPRDAGVSPMVRVAKAFPWFILAFLGLSLGTSLLPLPPALPAGLAATGRFLLVAALCALGLQTRASLLGRGAKGPVLLGLLCGVAVASASLGAERLFPNI